MLRKSLIKPVETPLQSVEWQTQELAQAAPELLDLLMHLLPEVMQGVLDPDLAARSPEPFLRNLQNGRLGDFSKRYVLAAFDHNRTVGVLVALPEGESGLHIYSMGVLPGYRGKGVGSTLLTKCVLDACARGFGEVVLDVHSDNTPAENLYRKYGFR